MNTSLTHTPAATITHTVISLLGGHDPAIAVHHARTPDARITVTLGGILMTFYNAAAAQSGVNQLRSQTLHWVELYTAGITWQIRDRAALTAALDTLGHLHTLAIAVFLDGAEHRSGPRIDPLTAAG